MTRALVCVVCRHEGWDVRMTGVDRGDDQGPLVDVALPGHGRVGGPPELDYVRVPERFVREPRCEDAAVCLARTELVAREAGG